MGDITFAGNGVPDVLQKMAVEGLTKKVGYKTIVGDLNLTAESGELIAVTGPNGAGKTTFFRMLAGMTPKSAGEILWDGERFTPRRSEMVRRVGLIGHRPMVYDSLTALENLHFFARMYGVSDPARAAELLRKVGLHYYRHEPVGTYSRGMQQRLAVARMLLHDPDLLLYDEPFTGLDAEGQGLFREVVQEMRAAGKIQLLITHHPEELGPLADREFRLQRGRAAGEGSVQGWNI